MNNYGKASVHGMKTCSGVSFWVLKWEMEYGFTSKLSDI